MDRITASSLANQARPHVAQEINQVITADSDPKLASFLSWSVGRLLLKDMRHGAVPNLAVATLVCIADWLSHDMEASAAWINDVDRKGRPVRLLRFQSIDDIARTAEEALLKSPQWLARPKPTAKGERLVHEMEDGYYVVELMTAEAIEREQGVMQHCVGTCLEDDVFGLSGNRIFSLRDPLSRPCATMELNGGSIIDTQGKINNSKTGQYRSQIARFIQANGYAVKASTSHIGILFSAKGNCHSQGDLPRGITIDGDLNLMGYRGDALPEDLTVTGNLTLHGSKIAALPRGLNIGGFLCISKTDIEELPDDLTVGEDLILWGSRLKHLPEGLIVRGDLFLRETDVVSLPENLKVMGNLDLSLTAVTLLPEGLWVGGRLDISDTGITSLPEGLVVGGETGGVLITKGLQIDELPDSIGDEVLIVSDIDDHLSVGEFRRQNDKKTASGFSR